MDLSPKVFTNKTIDIKLDERNYLQWKQQICITIASHKLEGYLDRSTHAGALIVNEDGSKSVNPSYSAFKEQHSAWLHPPCLLI